MKPLPPAFRTSCRFMPKPRATTELCRRVRAMPRLSSRYGCGKLRPKRIPMVREMGGESNPVKESARARTKRIFGKRGIDWEKSIRLGGAWASTNDNGRCENVGPPTRECGPPTGAESPRASFLLRRCRGGRGLRRGGLRDGGNDFGGGRLADLAVAV